VRQAAPGIPELFRIEPAELGHEFSGLLVAVCLGQRGEAGDVGEKEGGRGVAQSDSSYSSTLKLNIMPLSWCSAMWQ
jgi:hypothetical protein